MAHRFRGVFLDEAEEGFFEGWERTAAALLAGFRRTVGSGVDDPWVVEFVRELSLSSPEFRQLWTRHDTAERRLATVSFNHSVVGQLRLDRENLAIAGTDGIILVIHHAQPGTESAERLALLGSMVATPPIPVQKKRVPHGIA